MLEKHSITIRGHKTSYTLEKEFYIELKRIAAERKTPLATLITGLDETRSPERNLSSCLRVFVLENLKKNVS